MNGNTAKKDTANERLPLLTIISDILKGVFFNQYTLIAAAAVIPAAIGLFLGGGSGALVSAAASAGILMLAFAVQHFALSGVMGISRADRAKNNRSLDPRLMGSLGDISGIGSTFGVLAGIAVMLSGIYISGGGIFDNDDYVVPLLEAASRAISLTAVLTAFTGRESMRNTLYIISAQVFGLRGRNAVKRLSKVTRTPELMKGVRNMAAVRLVSVCAFSAAVIICALSGAGSPYTCCQAAWLHFFAVLLSSASGRTAEASPGGEKQKLWTKDHKTLCILNIILFTAVSVFFLFSFPVRSVYKEYSGLPEYDYYQVVEIEEEYPPFSVPDHDSTDKPLFTAFFLTSAFLPITVSWAALALPDVNGFTRNYGCCIAVSVLAVAAAAFYGPLSGVQWLAAAGIICFIIMINMIRAFFAAKGYNAADSAEKK
ncbi:MAG: hypothetical protein NC120_00080 [Ruminococcus sp.]|nr:hypothetical protein [Ruminococcus sp.]